MSISLAWNDRFPTGYGHTSIAYLRKFDEFIDAKNGNMMAAQFVVRQCIKNDRIMDIREKYPNTILLPVLGQNKLPLALAQAIGLPICHDVYIVHVVFRKYLCAIQRFLHKPAFSGKIQKGANYILVDDIITQGGTMSALRRFVISKGGNVVAVVALAYAIGSHAIVPAKRYVVQILVKFGTTIVLLLRKLGVVTTIQELTNSQARYLLRFASISTIISKIIKLTHDHSLIYAELK